MCNRILLRFGKLPQQNHVNGTIFQSGLRPQTGLSSLWVSCKRTLSGKIFLLARHFNAEITDNLFNFITASFSEMEG